MKSDSQEAIVRTFLSGLLDRRLVESTTQKKPTTLKDALQLLEEAQATKDFLKPKTGKAACLEEDPTYTLLADKMDKVLDQGKEIAALKAKVAAATQPQKSPAWGDGGPQKAIECYCCRKKGHIASECRVNLSNFRPAQMAPIQSLPKEKCKRCWETTHPVIL